MQPQASFSWLNVCVDAAGGKAGFGHLKRCLSIACELKRLGHDVEFHVDDAYDSLIREGGFAARKTMGTYDMILIDRYDIDNKMLAEYKKKCRLLVRIDDASPRLFRDPVSDVIINGNAYANRKLYSSVAHDIRNVLAGGRFVPMDRKICCARSKYRVRKEVKTIVVTFGGADMAFTLRVCKKIAGLDLGASILVLNGIRLKHKLDHLGNLQLLPFVNNMHEILQKADIVVCSSSSTCWQAAAVGVPCITFQTANNQLRIFQYVKKTGIGVALSEVGMLEKVIVRLSYGRRRAMSRASRRAIDCNGSKRIASHLHRLLNA